MKRPSMVTLLALAATAGCSSVPIAQVDSDSALACDQAYMARVERMAKEQRAELRWVNCPQLGRAKTS